MAQRNPSVTPFVILLVVGAAVWPFLPAAVAVSSATWALLLMGLAMLLTLPVLGLVGRLGFLPTVTAVLWLIPLLYGYFLRDPLCLLALVPIWRNLSAYLPDQPVLPWQGFVSSLLLQFALLLAVVGQMTWAVLLGAVGLGLIAWAKEPVDGRRWAQAPWTVLAVVVIFVLFSPPAPKERGSSKVESVAIAKSPKLLNGGRSENAHMALVVRPKVRAEDQPLPPPPQPQKRQVVQRAQLPVEIPFSGVYWLFQEPLMRVPAGAPEFEGTPADYRFHSDDKTTIRMQARQTFGVRYPLRRVRAIDVRMRGADLVGDTLAVEMWLEDSQGVNEWTKLEAVPVEGMGEQTVRFEVNPKRWIEQFDTIVLRFHVGYSRRDVAPRVAVEAFRFHTK